MSMTTRTPSLGQEMTDTEVRIVDDVLYMTMRTPGNEPALPGKPWASADLGAVSEEAPSSSLSEMQGNAPTSGGDPAQTLGHLRGASDSVKKLGVEEVRGARTTHYRAEIDLQKAAKGQGKGVQRAYRELTRQYGDTPIVEHVWLDGEGRVRRMRMDIPILNPAGTPSETTSGETEDITDEVF